MLSSLLLILLAVSWVSAQGLIPIRDRSQLPEDKHLELRQERTREVENLTAPLRAALRRPTIPQIEFGDRGVRAEVDTVKVLVCLLAYEENSRPDLTTIPADGKFMAASDTIPEYLIRVDPPPHDRAYFDSHMEALREFYLIQSYGKLEIEWEIAQGPYSDEIHEGLFLLSDMASEADSLSPAANGDEYWNLENLEHFVRTALDTIDAGLQAAHPGEIVVGNFDHVIIFHAGSDYQNDIFQDSPNDLPSFNIHFGEPYLIDGGQTELASVVLLPETTIQDVDPNDPVLGAINSVTAHEFGHQLGLVDTYNTYWGWPSVGFWDLMDSGHQLLYGFQETDNPDPLYCYGALPASFGIWHRMLLGWVSEADGSMTRFGGGERDVELTASNLQGEGEKALRVDLSDEEYFILENRQEILHTDYRFVWRHPETRVFLWVNPGDPDDVDVEYVNGGEYDLLIPQSGLLAWHVDERNFDYLYPLNIINLDDDRHVRLVEADGSWDLGDPYSSNWRGNDLDPFYTGNMTEWTGTTIPSTRLRDKTPSGFRLTDLVTRPYLTDEAEGTEQPDSVITFHVSLSDIPEGYPRDDTALIDPTLFTQPTMGTLLPDGEWLSYFMASGVHPDSLDRGDWIRSGTEAGSEPSFAPVEPLLHYDDYPVGAVNFQAPFAGFDTWAFMSVNSISLHQLPATGEPLYQPLLEDYPLGGTVLTGAISGAEPDTSWVAWSAWDRNSKEVLVTALISDQALGSPVYHSDLFSTPAIPFADSLPPRVRLSTIRQQRSHGGDGIFLLYAEDGRVFIVDPLSLRPPVYLKAPLLEGLNYWVRTLDINDDGYEGPGEIFWIFEDGRIYRIGEGEPELLFTARLEGETITVPPIPADLNGDGEPELLLAAGTDIYRYSLDGYLHADWPVRLDELAYFDDPMRVGTTLRAADMTGDDISELILFTQTGHLLIFGDGGEPLLDTPRSLAGQAPLDLYTPAGQVFAVSNRGYLLSFQGVAGPNKVADWPLDAGGQWRQGRWVRHHELGDGSDYSVADWIIYPNPAADHAAIYNPDTPAGTTCKVELFDLEGQRRIIKQKTSAGDGPWEVPLELGHLAPGIYLCRIEVDSGGGPVSFVRKLGVLR